MAAPAKNQKPTQNIHPCRGGTPSSELSSPTTARRRASAGARFAIHHNYLRFNNLYITPISLALLHELIRRTPFLRKRTALAGFHRLYLAEVLLCQEYARAVRLFLEDEPPPVAGEFRISLDEFLFGDSQELRDFPALFGEIPDLPLPAAAGSAASAVEDLHLFRRPEGASRQRKSPTPTRSYCRCRRTAPPRRPNPSPSSPMDSAPAIACSRHSQSLC